MGFSNVGMMSVEDTIEYQQETIAAADLVPAVPEQTRKSFERLRVLDTYGALCYDLYTVASDQSLIVLELALAERFVEFYGGSVQLAKGQQVETIPCDTYQAVFDALQGHGRFPARDGWRLRLSTGGKQVRFNGYLSDLFEWARSEGLLRGQRNRRLEPLIVKMRNDVAHARVTVSQHRSTRRVRSGTQQRSSTSSGVHQQRAVSGTPDPSVARCLPSVGTEIHPTTGRC